MEKIEYVNRVRNEISETFKRFDKDGNGILDKAEIKEAIQTLDMELNNLNFTDEEVDEMINKLDKDGDGQINFMEFIALLLEV